MDVIFTPWRWNYIKSGSSGGCFLCNYSSDDELVVHIGDHCMVVMNKFPYSKGHVMIAPRRHVSSIKELSDDEIEECSILLKASVDALRELLNPQDFNIGVNIGRVAGAGLEEHVHIHVVPRWVGTTGFDNEEDVLRDTLTIAKKLREIMRERTR